MCVGLVCMIILTKYLTKAFENTDMWCTWTVSNMYTLVYTFGDCDLIFNPTSFDIYVNVYKCIR